MNLYRWIWMEMLRRPGQSLIALFIVALGVSALVAIESVAQSSERKIAAQMRQLGANLLILPQRVSLQDYHAADSHGQSFPEEYVSRITMAQLVGVQELSPKLSVASELFSQPVIVTGILPRTELNKQSSWQTVNLLTVELDQVGLGKKHEGCGGHVCQLPSSEKTDLSSYASTRIVHELAKNSVLVGADLARRLEIQPGRKIPLLGKWFVVAGVLPPTGTTDDGRILAHLHRVQELQESGPVVNVIEVMACCEDVATGLAGELDNLLPNTRAVTISQIVETQVVVNQVMNRLSYILFGVFMLLGGASVACVMFANVSERRRELGTFMALGATPGMVSRLILFKAATLGLIGGSLGLLLGILASLFVGWQVLDLSISISGPAVLTGLVAATLVALVASYLPARRAARLDPCVCLQET